METKRSSLEASETMVVDHASYLDPRRNFENILEE